MVQYLYDVFRIYKKPSLSSHQYAVLATHYMPLIGIDGFAIYMLLQSLETDGTYSFKKVMDSLNFTSMKHFNQGLEKLEAMNLVKTYQHETKGYGFELNPPLSSIDFFANETLKQFLSTQLGEVEIEKMDKKPSKSIPGYKNISKKFSDVYQSSTETLEAIITKTFKPNIVIENKDFNYTLFKLKVDESLLPEAVLDDPQFQERIERISFTYKLDEEEMRDVLLKTIHINNNMEYASIARNASMMFQKKYKVSGPGLETIKEDVFVVSGLDDETQKILNMVENLSISDALESISQVKPSAAEIKMFDELSLNTKLPISVINILILYVNKTKGELPGYNYFEKIAVNLAMAKVKTAYDALNHFKKKDFTKSKNTAKPQAPKKVAKLPSWYQEYSDSLAKTPQAAESIIKENKDELINIVKDMFE
jgi:replication initiation and membrane attachment protein